MDKAVGKAPLNERIAIAINYMLLVVLCLVILMPLVNILALSLNDGKDASLGGIAFWPRVFSVSNYVEVFKNPAVLQGMEVTLFRTILGTFLSVLLTSMAAFALKNKNLPGVGIASIFIVFTMLFNGGIIPYFMVLKMFHLNNTIWVYIIPTLYSAWNLILVRTFFQSIDQSMEESAKIDGAHDFQVLFRIYIPLSMPVLSVICLFNGVMHWNDWFSGAFYVTDEKLRPLQTILQQMLTAAEAMRKNLSMNAMMSAGNSVTTESMKMAMVIISVVPIATVYPFIQKYFVQGIMVGSVKG
ncbi:carbohydrate ABC transporter permease [Paenibacillus sp. PsM32]|uniref:Carbohydrate ABC transporter permease n=1 Tax=Paenibacillus kyungheensis TaxID=1452732 RepID=A0AAX3M5P7_9BACL|nr:MULTISPECIES: carbohydrate ABC transporter permease [Paenibacillus]MDN4617349.1 carbohydrate ABC transporter permease [Paenibacillus sp. PsM32]MDQ1232802.1 putative aldouronate transport system permease protein [Paenibacillus sp. SORGH_AS_0306]MDR6109849.1 putative aldouronate transport system permease protein [Paenibacillus sp. SORGH_AS_0338]WCT56834.1 carbohydrate ABC transporter permease [Paenibacillus kyungheensis]WDF50076.1 carbohydrate ABC transporter permease [Paenibacillus sp. KACC 